MAFVNRVGSILRQAVGKHINSDISLSGPSMYQAIRCMSTSKIFVGGLSFNTDQQSLGEEFRKYGEVSDARVIVDRETGRSRGFGFVTFYTAEEASAAISAMDGKELHGRTIRVNYANERQPYQGGGGGFGGSGDYNSGGGGYNNSGGGFGGYGGGDSLNQGFNSGTTSGDSSTFGRTPNGGYGNDGPADGGFSDDDNYANRQA